MDFSTVNMVVHVSTCANDDYRMHGPKWAIIELGRKNIVMNAVGKVHKEVNYDDNLHLVL